MLVLQALIAMSLGLLGVVVASGATRIDDTDGDDWTVSKNDYPYLVSVQYKLRHVCHGSIINPYWILTSAHCLYGRNMSDIQIVGYSINYNDGISSYFVSLPRNIVIHKSYAGYPDFVPMYDIGMVRLSAIINGRKPIALPNMDYGDTNQTAILLKPANTTGTITLKHSISNIQIIEVVLEPSSSVECFLVTLSAWNMNICANSKDSVSMCPKDDGSPLIVKNFLVGIANVDDDCYGPILRFTGVWQHLKWIRYVMDNTDPTTTTLETATPLKTTTTPATATPPTTTKTPTTRTTTTEPTITTTPTTTEPMTIFSNVWNYLEWIRSKITPTPTLAPTPATTPTTKSFTLNLFFSMFMNASIDGH